MCKTKSNTAARLNSVSKDLEFLELYTKIASQAASQPHFWKESETARL